MTHYLGQNFTDEAVASVASTVTTALTEIMTTG